MRFVSTTSRTEPVLSPLPANRVHFRLNLVVRQFRTRAALPVGLGKRRVEPLGEKPVEQRSSLLGRELPDQIKELSHGNRDGQGRHARQV